MLLLESCSHHLAARFVVCYYSLLLSGHVSRRWPVPMQRCVWLFCIIKAVNPVCNCTGSIPVPAFLCRRTNNAKCRRISAVSFVQKRKFTSKAQRLGLYLSEVGSPFAPQSSLTHHILTRMKRPTEKSTRCHKGASVYTSNLLLMDRFRESPFFPGDNLRTRSPGGESLTARQKIPNPKGFGIFCFYQFVRSSLLHASGDAHIPPAIDAQAPTFQNVSGSGAEVETMQNLGHVLPGIPLADRKGSPETIRFLAHLWVLSVRTESTPPEARTR